MMIKIETTMIKKLLTLFVFAATFVSCTQDVEPIEYLDVNAHNISGSWKLVEWSGVNQTDDVYMYVNFVRNDKTFTIYQNHDSLPHVPHISTGTFYIETDVELGAIIRGMYDNDSGDWAHRYIVKELTATSMTWVAKDEPDYVQKFERVESIPLASEN